MDCKQKRETFTTNRPYNTVNRNTKSFEKCTVLDEAGLLLRC